MDAVAAVREAQPADISAIQRIAHETWAFAYRDVIPPEIQDKALTSWYSTESITAQLPADTNLLLVAQDWSDHCIGFAQFVRHSAEAGELTRIYVLPAHHGQGFGYRLLETGLDWLQGQGVGTLVVAVEEQNPIGRRFYERNGFTELRTQTADLFGHELSTVVYRRPVRSRTV